MDDQSKDQICEDNLVWESEAISFHLPFFLKKK